jgi:hypothetical protein
MAIGRLWPAAKLEAMSDLRLQLRPLSWIALVAILALAILPTLSHAWAHSQAQGAGGWAEVCTSQGPQRVAVDADGKLVDTVIDAAASSAGAAHLQHGPLCVLSCDVPPLPPAASAALPLALASEVLPTAFLHAPRTLFAWRSTQPRGPPAIA